ncbi:MAG: FapA family protein, partial [Planctomycetota bacterium]|nr:FapA family protein [Planctomycetota bacterium]
MAGNKWITVVSRKTEYGVFYLLSDVERLEAKLVGEMMQPTLTVSALNALLADMGVCFGIRQEPLLAIAQAAAEGRQRAEEVVAVGTPVVEGRDAYLEFHKRPAGVGGGGDIEAAKVDYREYRAFDNVKAGDLIATLHPAQEGEGGTDVFGKSIPVKNPRELTVLAGENVAYDPANGQFTATASGYVAYERGKIEVRPVYVVRGDVDLTQGNIRFIGRVEVGRDVRDAFEIQAEAGIVINGTAEACILRSGKEITIRGGVTGKGKGRIEAKESLITRFLDGVEVVCGGEVIVQKEIVNSKVYSLGRVMVRDGTIVGSEVVALRGILAREVGSELGVKTSLI